MIVQVHGTRYLVSFKHYTSPEDYDHGTSCFIKQAIPGEKELDHVAQGDSFLHDQDQFCRETGRKLSLFRALEQLFPYTEGRDPVYVDARKAFWTAYFGRKNKKSPDKNGNQL